jgi:hypothetical protein
MHPALEHQLSRVSNAIRRLPGAVELYLYGSASDPSLADAYSDLDLQVVCENFSLSQTAWPAILTRAGEIELAFPIEATPLSASFTIVYASESPYHKVDIGLSDQAQENSFIQQVKSKKLLWRQPAYHGQSDLSPRALSQGINYIPAADGAAHFMLGEMLSSIRYLKARKRGQHLTCWRFLSAKLNARLRCYQWNGDPQVFPEGQLSTWNTVALDRQLAEADRLDLLTALNLTSPVEMDRSLFLLTGQIVQGIQPRLTPEDAPAAILARHYMDFIGSELGFA